MMIAQTLVDGLHQTMAVFGAGLAHAAAYAWGCILLVWLLVAGFGSRRQ